jgi:hypothetical protein
MRSGKSAMSVRLHCLLMSVLKIWRGSDIDHLQAWEALTVQIKVFHAVDSQIHNLEATINDWLGTLPENAEVKRTDLAATVKAATNNVMQPCAIVTIWWQ